MDCKVNRKIGELVNNKRGNVAFTFVIFIFVLTCINLAFGIMETSLSVATVNELKDILEASAPVAARYGIDEEALKNETIERLYDKEAATNEFIDLVSRGIEDMSFRSRVLTSSSDIKASLNKFTRIMPSKGIWANTWGGQSESGDKKEIDYVIVSTVLPIELRNNYASTSADKIEKQFNVSNSNGYTSQMNVSVDVEKGGMGAFIKFEMKIILK